MKSAGAALLGISVGSAVAKHTLPRRNFSPRYEEYNMVKAIERLIELDELESLKQIERAAYQSLTDATIEALPDGLIVVDTTGKIVLCNEKAEFMFGYHRSEMLGQSVEKLMPERARARHAHDREVYNRFDISRRARTMGIGADLVAIRKDGIEFPVDITLARMVVPTGIHNLALVRFSRQIVDLEAAAQRARSPQADIRRDLEDTDAGR